MYCDNNWSHTVTKEIDDISFYTGRTILIKYLKM